MKEVGEYFYKSISFYIQVGAFFTEGLKHAYLSCNGIKFVKEKYTRG